MFVLFAATHKINVYGNKRIEKEAIKSYISDEAFTNQDVLNDALKKLYETGFFKDVKLRLEKGLLIVEVVEQPIINKIVYEGNSAIKADAFKQFITLKSGQTFSEFKIVDETSQKIEAIYRSMGFMDTKVLVQTRPVSEGRVDVVFKIIEGQRAFIRSIEFIGNKAISSKVLASKTESQVYSGLKFLSNNHYFSTERLQQDCMKLQDFYHNKGYPDAAVTSFSSELKRDHTGFKLTFSINEGKYFTIGNITLKSAHPQKIDLEKLKKLIPLHTGGAFNKSIIRHTEEFINDELNRQHISTAAVTLEFKRNEKDIDINIQIQKAPLNKIRFINIKGNRRTYERVIRSNLETSEGDFLNPYKVKQSEYGLHALEFFSKINVEPQEVSPNLYDLNILLEEAPSTGKTGFSIGYGDYDGFFMQIPYLERNVGGTGNAVQGSIMIANDNQEINFSLMNPQFCNMKDVVGSLSFNFDRLTRLEDRTSLQVGVSAGLSYNLGRYFQQRISYNFSVDHIGLKTGNTHNIADLFRKAAKGTDEVAFDKVRWGNKQDDLGLGGAGLRKRTVGGVDIFDSAQIPNDTKDLYAWFKNQKDDAQAVADEYNRAPDSDKTKMLKMLREDYDRMPQVLAEDHDRTRSQKLPENLDSKRALTEDDIQILRGHRLRRDLKIELWEDDLGFKIDSALLHTLIWRPFTYNPNRKFSFDITLNNRLSGLFGHIYFHQHSLAVKHLLKLPLHLSLKSTITAGIICQIGEKPMRLQDCMSLSSTQVKGFALEGLSPRDRWTGAALRGKKYYYGGVELKSPLFNPEGYGVNAGAYINFGNVWDSKFKHLYEKHPNRYKDDDWTNIRVSAGIFASLRIPMMPLRFDYTWILKSEKHDLIQRFAVGVDM